MIEEARSNDDAAIKIKLQNYIKTINPQVFDTHTITTVHLYPLEGGHSNITYLTTQRSKKGLKCIP